jgi:hypothetical protein
MADPIAVLALRRRRDQISGVIAEYERKIKEAQHDLAHVVASLRLFELTGDPSEFPPYIDLNRLLRRGETARLCLDAIKNEGPLDTRELTKRVMAAKGLNDGDKILARAIALRIVQTLRLKRTTLDGTEKRKGVSVWRFKPFCGAGNSPQSQR